MRIGEIRRSLTGRLRERRAEIEQAALARVHSVSGSIGSSDPEYLEGLRAAVSAALDYGIDAIERPDDDPAPIPTVLFSQARLAVRHGVKLETVLRRYVAGYALLGDFLIEESARSGALDTVSLKELLRVQAVVLDHLLSAVSDEYAREAKARPRSTEQRRVERVERLLAGELLDTAELGYDLDAHHIGTISRGPGAAEATHELAKALDRRCLIVRRDESTVWGWFGSRETDTDELERHVLESWPAQVSLAIGEPGLGFAGWRLTHRQAKAALPLAKAGAFGPVRYADVALLASIRQDDVLVASLRTLYLAPLAKASDGGAVLRETLRAYFATHRNVSSAAAILSVHRRTVANRLRAVEEHIGRSLDDCAVDLEMALRFDELA
jgi:DNA-binding PucR family transcriptional regulator